MRSTVAIQCSHDRRRLSVSVVGSYLDQMVPTSMLRILDVYCGEGSLGVLLKASRPNAQVWGIDPSHLHAQSARKVLDRFLLGRLDGLSSLDLPEGFFDTILLHRGFEDVLDPAGVLSQLKRFLSPEGRIVLDLPNAASSTLISGLFEGRPSNGQGYTPISARLLLLDAHYRLLRQHSMGRTGNEAAEVLVRAAVALGLDGDRAREMLLTERIVMEVEPVMPIVD
ncbi:MAG: class I SAM-dependent methyltransferase, partial [Alphaproteobacteria bacterium]